MPKYNALTWMHFKRNPYDKIAECKICKRKLSYKTTSANLKQHLKLKHGGVFQECLQHDLSQGQHDPPLANASSIKIWNYFEQNQDKGDKIADCRLCQRKLSYKTTITNLKQHLMKKHVLSYNEFLTESETVEIDSSEDSTSSDSVWLLRAFVCCSLMCSHVVSISNFGRKTPAQSEHVRTPLTVFVVSVWKFFERKPGRIATCITCNQNYSYRASTSNLRKHWMNQHGKDTLKSSDVSDRTSCHSDDEEKNIWNSFRAIDSDKFEATCKTCDKIVSYKGAADLEKHVRDHGKVPKDSGDELPDGEDTSPPPQMPLKRRYKSTLWKFFTPTDEKMAVCKLCKKIFNYGSTVSNLRRHLTRKHEHKFTVSQDTKHETLTKDGFLYVVTTDREDNFIEDEPMENGAVHHESILENSLDNLPVPTETNTLKPNDVAEEMLKVTDVWSYFDTDAGDIAKCVVCKSTVGNEYDELKAHLKDNHPKLLLQILQENDRNSDAASNDGNQDNDNIYTEIVYLEQDPPTETVIKTVEKHKSNTKSFKKREHVRSVHDTEEIPLKKAKNDDEDDELGMFIKYITCLLKKLPADVFSDVQIEILNTILKANSQVTANTSRNIVFNKEQVITRPNIITLDGITPLNTAMTGHNYTITVSPPKEN